MKVSSVQPESSWQTVKAASSYTTAFHPGPNLPLSTVYDTASVYQLQGRVLNPMGYVC